jgi:hypothetical protein
MELAALLLAFLVTMVICFGILKVLLGIIKFTWENAFLMIVLLMILLIV